MGSRRALEDTAGAVETRALAVNSEYRAAARDLDRRFSAPGTTPVQDRLDQYGEVRGLAYGGYGEASSDVHTLIEASASHLARTTWRWSGARSAEELRNALVTRYRRRVGVRVVKAFAAYRLERVPYIGMPRHIVESIRRDQRPEPPTIDIPLVVYTAQRDIDAQREMREGGPRGG